MSKVLQFCKCDTLLLTISHMLFMLLCTTYNIFLFFIVRNFADFDLISVIFLLSKNIKRVSFVEMSY